ncbi:MAG: Gfo/Idh/MocA family oxidoreductase [Bacteroidales bacterium]|nr:Gfo/Idh/MocA family oxidoreductase [Bacteroidales bacterium]
MRTKLILAFAAILALFACTPKIESTVPAKVVKGVIVTETPAREKGQESALQLTCEPIETVRIGFVGMGGRGNSALKRYFHIDNIEIAALCDIYPEKVASANARVQEAGFPAAKEYSGEDGYKALCADPDIDLVYITTDWLPHTTIAVCAMENGKHTAIEVPAAMNLEECWALVNTAEKTRRHCMMLENCVYDFFESSCLNMAQQGLLGEIYYAEGAYIHNLDYHWPIYTNNWRLDYNYRYRGDNYPTHGLGPVCQALDIHRGDRMKTLIAMDTRSYKGLEAARELMGVDTFANGEHTSTLIRTEKEKMINIQHNVYASRPYSRLYQLLGTEGLVEKYPLPGFVALDSEVLKDKAGIDIPGLETEKYAPEEVRDRLLKDFRPEIIKEIEEKARMVGGHGGMDYVMDYRLIYCLRNGLPLDMDVYDAAEWSCLIELTRLSLEYQLPVAVPDFTRGDWNKIDGYSYAVKE